MFKKIDVYCSEMFLRIFRYKVDILSAYISHKIKYSTCFSLFHYRIPLYLSDISITKTKHILKSGNLSLNDTVRDKFMRNL